MKINDNSIIAYGDVHHLWFDMMDNIKKYELDNLNIIQVGDFGVDIHENDSKLLILFNEFLIERNILLYVIRGNHDCPDKFHIDNIDLYSNIKLLPDYTVLESSTKKILCVGGAISIDRKLLIKKDYVAWWENEGFVLDRELLESLEGITHLITHNCMSGFFPYTMGNIVYEFSDSDKTLLKDLRQERRLIKEMWEILKLKNNIRYHYYGHFHCSNIEESEGCVHILLNIHEMKEIND